MVSDRSKKSPHQVNKKISLPTSLSALVFAAIGAANFFRIGYQLVLTAWAAVQMTGQASAMGYVLLAGCLTNLLFSPATGKLIDSLKRKKIIVTSGYLGIVFSGMAPLASGLLFPRSDGFPALIVTVVLSTISGIFVGGAMDYFLKKYIPVSQRIGKLASLSVVTQIGLVLGTACAGWAVSIVDFSTSFLVISACGAISILLCAVYLPNLVGQNPVQKGTGKGIFSAGPFLYLSYPSLFSVACCAALVFSLGQITNMLLPALISIHLKGTSVAYSLVEVSWSAGAFCISALMASKLKRIGGRTMHDLLLIAAMAGLLAVIPHLTSFIGLLVAHLVLGMGFSFVRVRSEARFLTICPTHLLGQFRANSLFLTSFIGLGVFATPIIYGELSVQALYLLFAGMVLVCAIALSILAKNRGAEAADFGAND
jgi:MFS family permease